MSNEKPTGSTQTVERGNGLYPIFIDRNKCTGCGVCLTRCKTDALKMDTDYRVMFDAALCLGLGGCINYCKENALKFSISEVPESKGTQG